MKSYLEVIWLLNTVFLYVSWHLASLLTQKKCSRHKLICSAVFQSLLQLMSRQLGIIGFLCGFSIFSFVLSGWRFLFWIESFLLYFVLIYGSAASSGMLVSNLMIYADADSLIWIKVLCVMVLLDYIAEHVLISVIENSELMIPVTVKINDQWIECIGYYDSGNFCMYEGKPVIFMRISLEPEMVIKVTGIGNQKLFPAANAQIQIGDANVDAVAAFVKDLQVECLLHRSMK